MLVLKMLTGDTLPIIRTHTQTYQRDLEHQQLLAGDSSHHLVVLI